MGKGTSILAYLVGLPALLAGSILLWAVIWWFPSVIVLRLLEQLARLVSICHDVVLWQGGLSDDLFDGSA